MLLLAIPDQIIALAYYSMSGALLFSARRRIAVVGIGLSDPATLLIVMFALFILSCGVGHQIDAWFVAQGICSILSPFKKVVNWTTASISATTAVVVVKNMSAYIMLVLQAVDANRVIRQMRKAKEHHGSNESGD